MSTREVPSDSLGEAWYSIAELFEKLNEVGCSESDRVRQQRLTSFALWQGPQSTRQAAGERNATIGIETVVGAHDHNQLLSPLTKRPCPAGRNNGMD